MTTFEAPRTWIRHVSAGQFAGAFEECWTDFDDERRQEYRDYRDGSGRSLLCKAVEFNQTEWIGVLLKAGWSVLPHPEAQDDLWWVGLFPHGISGDRRGAPQPYAGLLAVLYGCSNAEWEPFLKSIRMCADVHQACLPFANADFLDGLLMMNDANRLSSLWSALDETIILGLCHRHDWRTIERIEEMFSLSALDIIKRTYPAPIQMLAKTHLPFSDMQWQASRLVLSILSDPDNAKTINTWNQTEDSAAYWAACLKEPDIFLDLLAMGFDPDVIDPASRKSWLQTAVNDLTLRDKKDIADPLTRTVTAWMEQQLMKGAIEPGPRAGTASKKM